MALSTTEKAVYLSEFGIELWYPKLKLQNALEPRSISYLGSGKTTSDLENKNVAPEISEEAIEAAQVVSQAITTKQEPDSPRSSIEAEKSIRFALNLYIYNGCLVVSSLSSDYLQRQLPAQRLLAAILSSISNQSLALRHDHLISWPFFTSPNANQGIESAKQYVNGVIEHLVETHLIDNVLIFGGILPKLNAWTSPQGELFSKPYLVLPSLYKMLIDPDLKRKAWNEIQNSGFIVL